jgi:hypothetical protein
VKHSYPYGNRPSKKRDLAPNLTHHNKPDIFSTFPDQILPCSPTLIRCWASSKIPAQEYCQQAKWICNSTNSAAISISASWAVHSINSLLSCSRLSIISPLAPFWYRDLIRAKFDAKFTRRIGI